MTSRRFIAAVRNGLNSHRPLSSRILVGISGGQDSVALASALNHLPELSKRITLAHCNHGWPGDDAAAVHVSLIAWLLRLPLHIIRGRDVPLNEAGARHWRYAALQSIADSCGAGDIVVAHTRTDLAETALINLTSGAGADGVSAMRAERSLSPRHRLLRPMLDLSRAETADFCSSCSLPVWVDPYNSADFVRNRVRSRVFPILRDELNPQVERALARNAHLLRDDADALELLTRDVFVKAVLSCGADLRIRRHLVRPLHIALQRRLFRQVLGLVAKSGSHPCSFTHVESLCGLLDKPPGTRAVSLQGGAEACVNRDDEIVLSGGHLFCEREHERLHHSSTFHSQVI